MHRNRIRKKQTKMKEIKLWVWPVVMAAGKSWCRLSLEKGVLNVIDLIADPQRCVMAATQTRRTACAAWNSHRTLVSTLPDRSIPTAAGSALKHRHTGAAALSLPPSVMDYGREGNELQDTMEQRASRRKGRESEEWMAAVSNGDKWRDVCCRCFRCC